MKSKQKPHKQTFHQIKVYVGCFGVFFPKQIVAMTKKERKFNELKRYKSL